MKGFSLLELLIVLTLCASLVLISLPNNSLLMARNEKLVLINNIKKVIQYSRTQAVISGQTLKLSGIDKTSDWSQGVLLTASDVAKKEQYLYEWKWSCRYWGLIWKGRHGKTAKLRISNNPSQAISNGEFILTNKLTSEEFKLVLNRIGRIKE